MQNLNRFGISENEGHETSIIYAIASVYSLIEKRISDYLRAYNLSPSQFNALMIIKHIGKENGLSQIEIGDKLIVTASNMTRLLDKLKKEGLIERYAQENDRRVNLVKITPKGSEILDKAWPEYYNIIKEMSSKLDNKELEQLLTILFKWFNKLET